MDSCLANNDYPGVLHACGSIFETMAKLVVNFGIIDNQTLGSFFDRYRNESELPEALLDYIIGIYKKRNTEPLAGHGSTQSPSISQKEEIILAEMTKTFVRIERELSRVENKVIAI